MLTISNLTISYGDKIIVKDINATLNRGEILGITGANGSGKTTLCLAISALLDEKAKVTGSIEICGKNINKLTIAERATYIGIIFQDAETQLFSPTVEDEIAFAPENLCLDRKKINERIDFALKTCAIEHLRNRKTNTLSGGEKQLVAISAVIAMRPKILIADEITAHIDNANKLKIYEAIKEYSKEGAVLFVTHNRADAIICTRTLTLNQNL